MSPSDGRREERERMRERCLETDSHQECIGSLSVVVEGGGWCAVEDEVEEEEEGEFVEGLWGKSMAEMVVV